MRDRNDAVMPEDVTEEPPVGSQVTDVEGWVWKSTNVGWSPWLEKGGWVSGTHYKWSFIRNYAPLRFTTDADRERVGIDTGPDVDPDEALMNEEPAWTEPEDEARDNLHRLLAEESAAERRGERLTRERDEARDALDILVKRQADDQSKIERLSRERDEAQMERSDAVRERDEALRRAEIDRLQINRLTSERDEGLREIDRLRYNPVARKMKRQRDEAREVAKSHVEDARDWRRRYEALRADVGTDMDACPNDHTRHHAREILNRDDEWAKGEQR